MNCRPEQLEEMKGRLVGQCRSFGIQNHPLKRPDLELFIPVDSETFPLPLLALLAMGRRHGKFST